MPKLALIVLTKKAVCAVDCYALGLWQLVSCKPVQALSLLPKPAFQLFTAHKHCLEACAHLAGKTGQVPTKHLCFAGVRRKNTTVVVWRNQDENRCSTLLAQPSANASAVSADSKATIARLMGSDKWAASDADLCSITQGSLPCGVLSVPLVQPKLEVIGKVPLKVV